MVRLEDSSPASSRPTVQEVLANPEGSPQLAEALRWVNEVPQFISSISVALPDSEDLRPRVPEPTAPAVAAFIESLDRFLACLQALLGPTSFIDDVLLARDTRTDDATRADALRRLARVHFPRGRLFHPGRWPKKGALDRAFRAWRGDRAHREAWEDLLVPHILQCAHDMPRGQRIGHVHQFFRRSLRKAAQFDLLGRTTDAGDPTEKLRAQIPPSFSDEMLLADLRLDLRSALDRLPPADAALLRAYHADEADRRALAQLLGLSDAALRKRVERTGRRSQRWLV
jgi:hypothetical protein